jgi:hypothetical protein
MKSQHPALQAYQDLFDARDYDQLASSGGDVGRVVLETELKRRGIEFPTDIAKWYDWWTQIGGLALAKRLQKKWKKERREARKGAA